MNLRVRHAISPQDTFEKKDACQEDAAPAEAASDAAPAEAPLQEAAPAEEEAVPTDAPTVDALLGEVVPSAVDAQLPAMLIDDVTLVEKEAGAV